MLQHLALPLPLPENRMLQARSLMEARTRFLLARRESECDSGIVVPMTDFSTRASANPHASLKYGGSSPVSHGQQTVAGTTPESRKGNSGELTGIETTWLT